MKYENYKLINVWNNKNNEVVAKVLNEKDEKQTINIKYPYKFWIDKKDYEKCQKVLRLFVYVHKYTNVNYNIKFVYVEENKYYRVECDLISGIYLRDFVEQLRDKLDENNISNYESDLFPTNNFILDNNIEISEKYDILYWDIETRDTEGGIEIGRDRILSICAVDNKGVEYRICYDDEISTIKRFLEIYVNYDITVTWNGKFFDLPYLIARCKELGIYFSRSDPIHIDLMKVFMQSFAVSHSQGKRFITSYSLDNIAKEYINDSKLEIKEGGEGYGGRLWNLFNTDRNSLISYNLQDCKLLKRLDEEFNLISNVIEVSKIAKTPLSYTSSINSTMDFFILREARKEDMHFKSKPRNATRAFYEGAYVVEPIPDLYKNIYIYDFSSLYPNTFITFNVSTETKLDKYEEGCITTPNNVYYKQEKGLIPRILENLVALRYKYRDEQIELKKEGKDRESYIKEFQQTAIKIVILEIYGTMGSAYSRFFDRDIAETITLTGQSLIKEVEKTLNNNNFKVVAGDTDSVMCQILDEKNKNKVENLIKIAINKVVNKCNVKRKHTLMMKHEKTLIKFVVLAKKKYVGRCIYDDGKKVDELYYRGLELHKGSELLSTKELLSNIITHVFWKNTNKEELIKIILDYKKNILSHNISDVNKLIIVKKVGKMPTDYKNVPVHVQLAIQRKEKGDLFFVGKRIPFIVIEGNPLRVIHKDDYNGEYDEKYYWENQIYPPTMRFLDVVIPSYNWDKYSLGEPGYQTDLGDY